MTSKSTKANSSQLLLRLLGGRREANSPHGGVHRLQLRGEVPGVVLQLQRGGADHRGHQVVGDRRRLHVRYEGARGGGPPDGRRRSGGGWHCCGHRWHGGHRARWLDHGEVGRRQGVAESDGAATGVGVEHCPAAGLEIKGRRGEAHLSQGRVGRLRGWRGDLHRRWGDYCLWQLDRHWPCHGRGRGWGEHGRVVADQLCRRPGSVTWCRLACLLTHQRHKV